LRYSAATLSMAEGVPVKVASELLGHADVTTTLRIYSHVLPSMQDAAADAMDRLFGSTGG
jgi:integrase